MSRLTHILIAVLLVGCFSPTELDTRWEDPTKIQFATSLGIDLGGMQVTPSGLYWQDMVVGTGKTAGVGDSVRVHYTGWLPDGTVFETTRQTNQPLKFLLGVGLVIKGWDEGLVGMQEYGVRKLVVRPSLAYGRAGKGPVPPLATVVYEVELRWVKR